MATAFAIALGIPVADLIRLIGHDGSEQVQPLPDPAGRRGFHSQECIGVALSLGWACTEIVLFPAQLFSNGATEAIKFACEDNWQRFARHVSRSRGVIEGRVSNHGHAVAYENGLVLDPNGTTYPFSQGACELRHFYCTSLWRLDRTST